MNSTDSDKALPAWRSPWVMGWIGLVVAVLAVNATMVYFAITTNPGLVVDNYYDRGQDYERTMLTKLSRDPGWEMKADIPADIRAGEKAVVRLFLVDRAGQPVTPDSVELYAYRPSDKARDFSQPMVAEGRGRYAADVSFPLIGVWDTLVAVREEGEEYTVGQRIHVQRP